MIWKTIRRGIWAVMIFPHIAMWDIHDKGCQNYFTHFAHMVHFYGTKLCTSLDLNFSTRYVVNPPVPGGGMGTGGLGPMGGALTKEKGVSVWWMALPPQRRLPSI